MRFGFGRRTTPAPLLSEVLDHLLYSGEIATDLYVVQAW